MIDATPTLWDTEGQELMGWIFIEFPEFSAVRDDYFEVDLSFARFQGDLAANPEQGDLMQGCGGLRKLRWGDLRRGKGKRGGLRVIYLLVPEACVVVLVDVYDKSEADDLSEREKREVARLAKETKSELLKRHRARKGEIDDKA